MARLPAIDIGTLFTATDDTKHRCRCRCRDEDFAVPRPLSYVTKDRRRAL